MADQQALVLKKLDELKETLDEHGERLERIEGKEDALSGDVEQLLLDVKGIRDDIGLKHQRDKREIDEIKTHLGLPLMPDVSEL